GCLRVAARGRRPAGGRAISRRVKSLGLQLVADLARQLGGSLVIGPGPGAVFEVTFRPGRQDSRATGGVARPDNH
ncbi:MAG: hypothetical protein KBH14_07675, partial [Vicinamibacteria bacterium]|nr:hypothetical protein [Vicinamibacteria bacterium]